MTDTVAERLCVYNLPCGADNDFFLFYFFWKWQHCSNHRYFVSWFPLKDNTFEMQAPAPVHHILAAKHFF